MAPDVIELSDPTWQRHDFYMRLAMVVESGAKCLGSHVGAVIVRDDRVLGSGYNGTPAGYPNCTDAERGCRRCALRAEQPDARISGRLYDICLCVHAEQNAMATAARFGTAIDGAMLYTTLQPCFNCLKELMQVRLRGVIFRRAWQAGHPDYAWVAAEYDRLIAHYRSKGNVFMRLEQVEEQTPVGLEIGHPI
ncbi:MAG: dCMP deaminase family protein [Candidatus Limnocylindrales bacterium]|jgi:dCMP deaminase